MHRILPAIVALLWPALALAEEFSFPPRHPGLWEQTMVTNDTTIQSKTCIDAATDHALLQHGMDAMRARGGTFTVKSDGNQLHITASADLSGHVMAMTEDFTLINDTTVQGRGHIHIVPPYKPGATDSDIRQDSHWIGPCPPDMQPGDALIGDRKINLLERK